MPNNSVKPSLWMRILPLTIIERNYVALGLEAAFYKRLDIKEHADQCGREKRRWEAEYQRRGFEPITREVFHQSSWGKTIDPKYLRIPIQK